MKKITINPSVAVVLDIDSIGKSERVELTFTADSPWTGAMDFIVCNSAVKNSITKPVNALSVNGMVMSLVIEPTAQAIAVGSHYYEIINTSSKRVVFKGALIIKS